MKNRTLHCNGRGLVLAAILLVFAFRAVAGPVDAQRARLVAKNFLNINDARSTGLRDISAEAGFANVYVFSTDNSFVLVPADDRLQPVLGYSLNGKFDYENMPENKAAWIQEYSDAVAYAIEHQTRATDEVLQQWNDLAAGRPGAMRAVTVVAPLLTTHWNQGTPYNMLCPSNSVTGCVATAMAQVMKYWNYPSHGIGTHTYTHSTYGNLTADFQSTNYDWTNMLNDYTSSSTQVQKLAVATLMYHCGVSVNMDYSPSSSGAPTAWVADALKTYFNYSSQIQHYYREDYTYNVWIGMLKSDLDLLRPIQYHGSNDRGGHSFVFDGYNSSNYFHVNWGWGGYQDEYYGINGMSPGTGGTGSGSGTYNLGQGAILGIHPSDCVAAAPANLTYTQSGRNVTLSWNAGSGAVSYNVYYNGIYVGNTISTTFDHLAFYGSNRYWVRSVDATGEMSLSSNDVTVTVDYETPVVDDLTATVSGSNVTLNWTAPDWCYPSVPTVMFTHGGGIHERIMGYNDGSTHLYWGHRYPASILGSFNGMGVYKVSFYAVETGNYKVYVYQGTNTSNRPQTLVHQQTLTTENTGWVDIDLTSIVTINASQDLWVFMYDPEIRAYPASYCFYSGTEGNYYSASPTNPLSYVSSINGIAFNIRTYVSDGAYTYNIFRDGVCLDSNVGSTTYTDSDLASGTYHYTVKTNYYGGETAASNVATAVIGGGSTTTHTASLANGWSWWSTYIEQEGIDGLTMLENSLGNACTRIQSRMEFIDNLEYMGYHFWDGTLNAINNEESYRIRTNAACQAAVTGAVTTPAAHPITVNPGWNWIGFPSSQALGVTAALSSFSPTVNDQIKGRYNFATYLGNYGGTDYWDGYLTTLEPGQGYMYKSNATTAKTLVYQTGSKTVLLPNGTTKDNFYTPVCEEYADNMTIIAEVEIDGTALRSEYELAAFAGNECRGSVKLKYVEPLDRYLAFLMVFGDGEEALSFVLTDGEETLWSNESLMFTANGALGTPAEPLVLYFGTTGVDESEQARINIYPNPSNGVFNVEGNGIQRVEVLNAMGQTLFIQETQDNRIQIDLSGKAKGMYLLRVVTENGILSNQLLKY